MNRTGSRKAFKGKIRKGADVPGIRCRSGNVLRTRALVFSILVPLLLSVQSFAKEFPAGPSASEKRGRYYEPVEVPGELFPAMLGAGNGELALFAWKEGTWRPVLFQVDERTPSGSFILPKGPEANGDEANGILDGQDLLVFMARDAKEKAPPGRFPPGSAAAVPIELEDPDHGSLGWVYLARFEQGIPGPGLRPLSVLDSREGVFHFRFPTYRYQALTNTPDKKPTPTIYMDTFRILEEAGGSGENIIDRQKTRGLMTFLGGLIKVRFNESIVRGGVVAHKAGPVRILTHSCMFPRFRLGIKGPKFIIDSILVDTLTLTRIVMNIPFNPGYVMHEMKLAFGTDLTPAAKGMRFHNSVNPKGFRIDGAMDEEEEAFDTTKDEWRLISGPQGTQITCTRFDPKFLDKGDVISTYSDHETHVQPPENFPGNVGASFDELTIRSLPAGTYTIEVFGCVPYDFYDPKGLNQDRLEDILNIRSKPLVVRVGDRQINNTGCLPQTLTDGEKTKP